MKRSCKGSQKSWMNTKSFIQFPVQRKNKVRRITISLAYQAQQNNLEFREIKLLNSLLKYQKKHPQLTKKQWKIFIKYCLKGQLDEKKH